LTDAKKRRCTFDVFAQKFDQNVIDGGMGVRRQQHRLAESHQQTNERDDTEK
jgi:hypothetical protein